MKKPAVMHLVHTLAPGGMENGVVNVIRRLADEFDFSVCCLETTGVFQNRLPDGIPVHQMHKKPGRNFFFHRRISRLLKENGINLLHTHNLATQIYGCLSAAGTGIRLIAGEHGDFYFQKNVPRYLWYRKILSLRTSRIHSVSHALRKDILELTGINPAKVTAIQNGVDLELFRPGNPFEAKKKLGISDPSVLLLGAVGRLIAVKNYPLLFEAVAGLKQQFGAYRLFIFGDGPLKNTLVRKAAEYGLAKEVVFWNHRDNLSEIYPAFDFLVHSSDSEGLSNVLMEAMACGRPVIASDLPANRELINPDRDGLLFQNRDVASLRNAIRQLAQNQAQRETLGRAARQKMARYFPLEKMAEQYRQIYRSALKK